MKNDFSIVFMGTPEFAVSILKGIVDSAINVKGVVTAPDKPAGRGQKIHQSAVKEYALAQNLKILQPVNLKDEGFINELKALDADLFVVVAFRMLPEVVWSMPPMGTINLHASLLPQYRGAAPINWAIINGERKTGVSTFYIEQQIDTGKIIEQAEVEIGENTTLGELYQTLMELGSELMLSTIEKIKSGTATGISQTDLIPEPLKEAPKIFKEDCQIDFDLPVAQVHNFCRGLSPYPGAWCIVHDEDKQENKTFKLYITRKTDHKSSSDKKIISSSTGLLFPCSDYYLEVRELQAEGKRRMNFKEFLAGNSIENLRITPLKTGKNFNG